MIKNLHAEPFDEGTITKLEIFERYAEAWLPVFITRGDKNIYIFDFFAGTGYDLNNISGSSIRLLKQIENFIHNIKEKKSKIHLYLNEYDEEKFQKLKDSCETYLLNKNELKESVEISYCNSDFAELFEQVLPSIKQYPSLVYLDQNGIKYSSDNYFLELANSKQVDFLYYISSSYFWRFGSIKEFKMSIEIDMEKAKANPYKYIHKSIFEQLKQKLPKDTKTSLYPFSIKKGSGIYGIIFGTSHILAADKFLSIAWKKNPINGEANFDIDNDEYKSQPSLFPDIKPKTKIEIFSELLKGKINNKELKNNKDVYDFTISRGHISDHAVAVVKNMKTGGKISYNGQPLINYDKVYKEKRIIFYEVLP
jgi:three-Cys-motif partner protein